MTILSKLLDRLQGPKVYMVVDDEGDAMALHPGRVLKTDTVLSGPFRYAKARKIAKAINKENNHAD